MARPHRSLQQEIEFILLIVEPRSGASVAAAYPLLSWSVRRDWLLVASILAAIWLSVWRLWADTLRYWLREGWPRKLRSLRKMMEQQLWSGEVYGYG
jgi:hypothetical protein